MAKVEVRPIETKKWHDKQGKDSFSRPKVIEVLYNHISGRYDTGLTEEEAAEYGSKMGVDLSDTYNYDTPHPFWSTKPASISLLNQTMIFDTDRLSDYIKVKNMKASKFVANSKTEYDSGLWPFATHIIFDEAEEVAIKANKIEKVNRAITILGNMTTEDRLSIVQILRGKNLKKQSPNFLTVEIDDIIENDVTDFLKYAGMGREEVSLRATVLDLVSKNILTKDGAAIFYMGQQLGFDYESTLVYLRDPANQKLKIAIFEKLNR